MKVGGEITLSFHFTSEYNLISNGGCPEYGSLNQLNGNTPCLELVINGGAPKSNEFIQQET